MVKNEWIRPISTNTYTKYMVKMSGSDPFLQIHNLSKNILGKNEWIRPISTYT